MIRIAIVEDADNDIHVLKEYLNRYGKENEICFQIHTFHDGLDIVSDYEADYDIVLLDIQMKHLDGMSTARKIRELDENVAFIFITSTPAFAVQGYLVDALGYVLKPVSYLGFTQILSKAVRQALKKQIQDYLIFDVEGGQVRLDISYIFYIESQRHNILIHSEKGDFVTYGPMKKTETILMPKGFSKCHNAYLVNLKHVTGILKNNVILSEKTELPISRNRKKSFMDSLADYIGGIRK